MPVAAFHAVEGHVSFGFEAVREAFADNFARRHELGGACCAYYRGEKLVDLWGGIRNKQTGEPWERDTMVVVHSATKGLAAMTLAIAHSRGWLDYEERVATYWSVRSRTPPSVLLLSRCRPRRFPAQVSAIPAVGK
jgi:CubicO group peptidase (beta-lactamase class C family)